MRRTILCLSLALALPAMAARLQDVADANYSVDPGTGLHWLDLKVTAGMSFSQVQSGGWLSSGWRYATDREVNRLFRDNLLDLDESRPPRPDWGYPGAYLAREQEQVTDMRTFAAALGGSFKTGAGERTLAGWYRRVPVAEGADKPSWWVGELYEDKGWAIATTGDVPGSYAHATGFFLVSAGAVPPVPEPATYGLMMAGLGVVGWVARGRRQRGGRA